MARRPPIAKTLDLLSCINIWIALRWIYLFLFHLHWCTYEPKQTSRLSWWSRRSLSQPFLHLLCFAYEWRRPLAQQSSKRKKIIILKWAESESESTKIQKKCHENIKFEMNNAIRCVLATIEFTLYTHASYQPNVESNRMNFVWATIRPVCIACKQPNERKYPSGIINN